MQGKRKERGKKNKSYPVFSESHSLLDTEAPEVNGIIPLHK